MVTEGIRVFDEYCIFFVNKKMGKNANEYMLETNSLHFSLQGTFLEKDNRQR